MSFHNVTMSADEAVRELKAAKVLCKDMIAIVQSHETIAGPDKTVIAARYQRRVDALKLAIVALGGTLSQA